MDIKLLRYILVMMVTMVRLPWAVAGPKPADHTLAEPKMEVPKATAAAGPDAVPKATGRPMIVRRPDETLAILAHRILPRSAEILTRPVEMEFPPLGKVIVVIYLPPPGNGPDGPNTNFYSNYRVQALVPDGGPGTYRAEALPPLEDREGMNDYTVKSVFTADADGNGSPELCILSAVYVAGTGERAYYDTEIFRWSGSTFLHFEQDDNRPFYGLRNAKAVRARIKKMLLNRLVDQTKALR